MWGTYLKQMVNKYILLQFMVGSPRALRSHICVRLTCIWREVIYVQVIKLLLQDYGSMNI